MVPPYPPPVVSLVNPKTARSNPTDNVDHKRWTRLGVAVSRVQLGTPCRWGVRGNGPAGQLRCDSRSPLCRAMPRCVARRCSAVLLLGAPPRVLGTTLASLRTARSSPTSSACASMRALTALVLIWWPPANECPLTSNTAGPMLCCSPLCCPSCAKGGWMALSTNWMRWIIPSSRHLSPPLQGAIHSVAAGLTACNCL
jgi:hypothetical protein